jgi:hypothetical protein
MKEIIIHLIDKSYDNLEGCMVLLLIFGLVVIIPIALIVAGIFTK